MYLTDSGLARSCDVQKESLWKNDMDLVKLVLFQLSYKSTQMYIFHVSFPYLFMYEGLSLDVYFYRWSSSIQYLISQRLLMD